MRFKLKIITTTKWSNKLVKKRIVMVLTKDFLKPYLDIRVYKEATALVEHGYDVTILCRVYSLEGLKIKENYEGINLIRESCQLPEKSTKNRLVQLFQNFKNVRQIANRIIKLKPDLIHAHDLNSLREAVLAKRKMKVPLIYDSHEDWPKLEQNKGNNVTYISSLIYEQFHLYDVDLVITVNKILAEKFFSKNNTEVIHNYPYQDSFKVDNNLVSKIKTKYNLDNKIVVEYHGVIGKKKGIDTLIEIANELIKNYKNLRFLIIGPGYEEYNEEIETRGLEKKVIFTGPVEYSQIPSYISASDIGYIVLPPSNQYLVSTPTKLFEAMSLGKPVIANAEYPEVQRVFNVKSNLRPGVLTNYSPNKIKHALEKLIQNKELREKLGKNGEKLIMNYFSWESEKKKLIDWYEVLINK